MAQPAAADPLQTGQFTFSITTSDPVLGDGLCDTPAADNDDCSHVLNSITITATGDTFTTFTSPSSFNAVGFPSTATIGSLLFSQAGDFNIGDATYDADMTANVFSDTDLNRYQTVDSNANDGFFQFTYPTPIPATSDFFFLITERNGNNSQFVEAFDDNGVSLGSVTIDAGSADYSNAGVEVGFGQNAFIALIPLSEYFDSSDPSRRVQSFRITNSSGSSDGGDHKAFVIGNAVSPTAVDDSDLNNAPGPVTVDILANDTPTGTLVGSTVELAGSTGPGQPVVVPGQGTWSVNTTNGEVTFTPEPTFADDPDPIGYTVEDGGGLTTNQATITITYLIDPELTLVKTITNVADTNTANPLGGAGDTITYSLTATNTGNVSLADVAITDALLSLTDELITPNDLAPGESGTLTDTYVIQPADVTAGEVENTATASGRPVATTAGGAADPANTLVDINGDDLADVTDTSDTGSESAINGGTPVTIPNPETVDSDGTGALDDDPTVLVLPATLAPEITLVKTVTDVADTSTTTGMLGDADDTITYTFTVTNTGNTSLADISIEDASLSPTATAVPTNLLPGASTSVTRTYVITPADVTAGEVENTATVTGTPVDNDAGGAPDPTNPLGIGDVTDTSDTGSESAINGGTPVTIPNPETVDSDGTGALDDDPTVLLLPGGPAPEITLVKQITSVADTDTSNPLGGAGDTVTYTFTVTNTGNTSLAGITITDPLLSLTDEPVAPADLAPGGTATLTETYVIQPADVTAGQIVNTATTSGEPVATTAGGAPDPGTSLGLGNVTDTSDTGTEADINGGTPVPIPNPETVDSDGTGALDDDPTVLVLPGAPNPEITLVKQITSVADTSAVTGTLGDADDTINYTLTVTNTGNTSLANITVTDPLLGLTGASVTPDDLAPGGTATITGSYVITPADVTAGRVDNTATATGEPVATTAGGAPDPGTSLGLGNVTDTSDTGTEADINGGTPVPIPNPETVDSDGTGALDDDPTVLLLPGGPAPEITLVKQITSVADTDTSNPLGGAGDTVTYTFTVTNTGNTSLAGITITDPLLSLTDEPVAPADLAPGGTATLTETYVIQPADVTAGQIVNTATTSGEPVATTAGGAPDPGTSLGLGNVTDTSDTGSGTDINGGTPVTIPNPETVDSDGTPGNDGDEPTVLVLNAAAAPPPPGLVLTKTTPSEIIQRGQLVPYTIRLQNNTGAAFGPVDIIDTLPDGFVYVPGTTQLDGVDVVPTIIGNTVTVSGVASPPGSERVVTLTLRALTGTNPGSYVNTALALDPVLGLTLGPATATVRILPEAVFDCGEVVGRVFNDLDGDGYQDSFEPGVNPAELTDQTYQGDKFEAPELDPEERGLPGVRLITLDGLVITTDENGLFSVPCAALPADRGSNFLLSLDERTLPLGFAMTTENPRVMRLTPGMLTEMNFGARLEDQVRIDLNAHAFGHGTALSAELRQGLVALADYLAENPSGVALSYHVGAHAGPGEVAEGRARMALVEDALEEIWRDRGGGLFGLGLLDIEQSIQRAGN